jgi:hypothetical protein
MPLQCVTPCNQAGCAGILRSSGCTVCGPSPFKLPAQPSIPPSNERLNPRIQSGSVIGGWTPSQPFDR